MMIREFKDNLTVLKEIEELEIIRELEIEKESRATKLITINTIKKLFTN